MFIKPFSICTDNMVLINSYEVITHDGYHSKDTQAAVPVIYCMNLL